MAKVSIVIPVYYNHDNLEPLYHDLCEKLFCHTEYEWELVMVDDGSQDDSWSVMESLAARDSRIRILRLSRNFGSHAAMLCGMAHSTGDCVVSKAADLQEPTEMILDMVSSWERGNNVVLAVREGREESAVQRFFAATYYMMVQKLALRQMPSGGFDVFLLDRKVAEVLERMDEKDSAITGQILWSGFKTDCVHYTRKAREIGKSRWTLKKKIRLVTDTLFSFSTVPITFVSVIGTVSLIGSLVWALVVFVSRLTGKIAISGFTTLFIFQLFSFGVIMLTLGILGGYLWRTFNASRNRPLYIIERDSKPVEQEKEEDSLCGKDRNRARSL